MTLTLQGLHGHGSIQDVPFLGKHDSILFCILFSRVIRVMPMARFLLKRPSTVLSYGCTVLVHPFCRQWTCALLPWGLDEHEYTESSLSSCQSCWFIPGEGSPEYMVILYFQPPNECTVFHFNTTLSGLGRDSFLHFRLINSGVEEQRKLRLRPRSCLLALSPQLCTMSLPHLPSF